MEVYQSSKTAAEMEYALSAIPSIGANNHWFIGDQDTGVLAEGLTPYVGAGNHWFIGNTDTGIMAQGLTPYVGENGNWWVGETDTGVYASGVKVTGAEVGQTIVVKAVDENGMPTEWECAELPSNDWREIAEITIPENLEDDTSGITWRTNDSGAIIGLFIRGLSYKKMCIQFTMLKPANGTNGTLALAFNIGYFVSNKTHMSFDNGVHSSGGHGSGYLECLGDSGLVDIRSVSSTMSNGAKVTMNGYSPTSNFASTGGLRATKITDLSIYYSGGIAAGGKIKIWGVAA